MRLRNKTKNSIIHNKVQFAQSFKDRLLGLLNEKKDTMLIFETRFGIHTFGMQYPLTIIVLDKKNKVIQIKENLKPNRLFFWNPLYAKIIESPISHLDIETGDILELIK